MGLVTDVAWLEPLLPTTQFPQTLLDRCDQLKAETIRLEAQLAKETAKRVGDLLVTTNSFYSNLIEGQYTEPLELAKYAPKREPKELTDLAHTHMRVQYKFERTLHIHPEFPWAELFAPAFVERVHKALFIGAAAQELTLENGSQLIPGKLRDDNVRVGNHIAPDCSSVTRMLECMQQVYGQQKDFRYQLLGALAYHHRCSWVHPFFDGNGRTLRIMTHLHLYKLGLLSPLWSLSRGLARRQSDYYRQLSNADQSRQGDLDGRGQLTQKGLFDFLDFMLDTCLDQVSYMRNSLSSEQLRAQLAIIISTDAKFIKAGIRIEAARALHLLIKEGKTSRSDFKVFLGLGDRIATHQLSELIALGVVESLTPKARELYPRLPAWFAQQLFPSLHRRFI